MRSVLIGALALVVVSACGMVYVRHQHRLAFVELQKLLHHRDQLNTQWGQLLLEQSTFSFHHYVNTTASERLGMFAPPPEDIAVIDERQRHIASQVERTR